MKCRSSEGAAQQGSALAALVSGIAPLPGCVMPSEFSRQDSCTVRTIAPGNAQIRNEKVFKTFSPSALMAGTGTPGNIGVTVAASNC